MLASAPLCAVDEQGLSPLLRKLFRDFAATGLPLGLIPSPAGTSEINPTDDSQTKEKRAP